MTAAWIILAVIAVGGGWLTWVRRFPWRDCPRCDGGKRISSGYAHRDCGRCGATGRVRRWGAGKGQ